MCLASSSFYHSVSSQNRENMEAYYAIDSCGIDHGGHSRHYKALIKIIADHVERGSGISVQTRWISDVYGLSRAPQ